jgi:hypothetical protein
VLERDAATRRPAAIALGTSGTSLALTRSLSFARPRASRLFTMLPFAHPLSSARRRAAFALAACLLYVCTGHAQDVTEPALKAAFIYNFAKFTDWPADALAPSSPFNACVLGDAAMADSLERAVVGRHLAGRDISVSRVNLGGALRSCHLLYLSGVQGTQLEAVMTSLRGAPVLTISDADDFTRLGIAHVFVDSGKMRFNFNLDLAKQAHLQLSSKLLALAAHVRGGPGSEIR